MTENPVFLAAGLTLMAGLATGIGGAIAFYAKRTKTTFLAIALGFSAGVMIYVSMMEIMVKSVEILTEALGERGGNWSAVLAFFGGMFFIALIDRFIPSFEERPGATRTATRAAGAIEACESAENRRLLRMGLFTALAVAIHNFPEGFITFFTTLRDPMLGVSIAVAVAIHNIPEGIAVAVPIWFATRSRGKAFFYSFLSGLAEPVGALVAFLVLLPFIESQPLIVDGLLAAVAGIMVFISFDELLPTAREYGKGHTAILGVFLGMAVMAVSLLLV